MADVGLGAEGNERQCAYVPNLTNARASSSSSPVWLAVKVLDSSHQELVLSNYPLILLDGPSMLPYDVLIYHKYHMSMSDVQLELMDSNIRIRACAGLADHESAAVETRDIIHFVRIWNGFSGKASSLQADMHGVLANLLGLSATVVANIPASQRMKSICASYGILQTQMLFTLHPSEPRATTESGTPYVEIPIVSERWIPDFPDKRGMIQGSAFPGDFGMRATSHGFHIQSSECMILLKLDRPPQENSLDCAKLRSRIFHRHTSLHLCRCELQSSSRGSRKSDTTGPGSDRRPSFGRRSYPESRLLQAVGCG
jgi:hypothetical protein